MLAENQQTIIIFMKRIIAPVFMALLLSVSAISCKKEYNCSCQATDSNGQPIPNTKTNTVINDTKKNAESQCNKTETTNGVTVTCAIQ